MTDIARLNKVIDYIAGLPEASVLDRQTRHHPAEDMWYQGAWNISEGARYISEAGVIDLATGKRCGSAMCLAGHAVLMFGENGTELCGEAVCLPGGRLTTVKYYAMDLLELAEADASTLFHGANRLPAIREMARAIAIREAPGS